MKLYDIIFLVKVDAPLFVIPNAFHPRPNWMDTAREFADRLSGCDETLLEAWSRGYSVNDDLSRIYVFMNSKSSADSREALVNCVAEACRK